MRLLIIALVLSACYYDPDPINLKRTVTYSVNSSHNVFAIIYQDADNIDHDIRNVPMPWSYTFTTTVGDYVKITVVGYDGYNTIVKLIVDGKIIKQMSSTNEGMLIYEPLP